MAHLPAIPTPLKQRALALAAEVGAAEAARRTSVNPGTIRSWRYKEGSTAPRPNEDLASWVSRKEAAAQQAWAGATEALERTRRFLAKGQAANARASSIAYGIMTEMGLALDQAAQHARERDKRIAPETAQIVAQMIRRVLDDPKLGLTADQKRMALPLIAEEFRAQDREGSQ